MQEWMLLLTMMTEQSHRRPAAPPPSAEVTATMAPRKLVHPLSMTEKLALRQAVSAMSGQAAPELRYDVATRFYLPDTASAAKPELAAGLVPQSTR